MNGINKIPVMIKKESQRLQMYKRDLENKGINSKFPIMYIEVTEDQNPLAEMTKIEMFLEKYLEHYATKYKQLLNDLNLEFINYGRTEMVYVLTDNDNVMTALSVKQPAVQVGSVFKEVQNLLELKEKDSRVVAPIDYFRIGNQELYAAPYISQARCVANFGTWGVYVPEPYYRFEEFTLKQASIINSCMVAKLVSLYNFQKQEGISNFTLDGGDFILLKGWEKLKLTRENIFKLLYLVAARDKLKCSFEEYLAMLKEEFLHAPLIQRSGIFNYKISPMQMDDIDKGIEFGKTIINNQKKLIKKNNH